MPDHLYYEEHAEKLRAQNRAYYAKHRKTVLARQTHNKTGRYRAARRWRRLNRRKVFAHRVLNYVIRAGLIRKPARCQKCGKRGPLHAHHHRGYSRPLDVIFLCHPCHGAEHRR